MLPVVSLVAKEAIVAHEFIISANIDNAWIVGVPESTASDNLKLEWFAFWQGKGQVSFFSSESL